MYSLNVLYKGILSCSHVHQKTKSEQRHFHRLLERQQKEAPKRSRSSVARGNVACAAERGALWRTSLGGGAFLSSRTRVLCEPINRDGSPRGQERNQEEPKRRAAAGAARESFTGSPPCHSSFSISHVGRFTLERDALL